MSSPGGAGDGGPASNWSFPGAMSGPQLVGSGGSHCDLDTGATYT